MARIVLIEDNALNARLAERLLTRAGHHVTTLEDGENGYAHVIQNPPDIVLLDLGLPDIDGQTIAAMIRQHPELNHTRLVAFTAWPEAMAAEIAQAYGCDGVINKPIDTRRFAAQVEQYLS
jgi:two-component system cell cycle response regulator DivK